MIQNCGMLPRGLLGHIHENIIYNQHDMMSFHLHVWAGNGRANSTRGK